MTKTGTITIIKEAPEIQSGTTALYVTSNNKIEYMNFLTINGANRLLDKKLGG